MAIKVGGVTVINNARQVENVTGASGVYTSLHQDLTAITTVIDFTLPMMIAIMSSNTTFTEANKTGGRTAFLFLDTGDSPFVPTFSANIIWPDGTEPTWTSARYWQIGLVCWSATEVRATVVPYQPSAPVSETVALSGSNTSYNTVYGTTASGIDARAGWKFKTDGTLFKTNATGGTYNVQFGAGSEWCNGTPSQTYYINGTVQSGGLGTGSSVANAWLALNVERTFQVVDTSAGGFVPNCSMLFRIASDSGGANILASGYYAMIANQEP